MTTDWLPAIKGTTLDLFRIGKDILLKTMGFGVSFRNFSDSAYISIWADDFTSYKNNTFGGTFANSINATLGTDLRTPISSGNPGDMFTLMDNGDTQWLSPMTPYDLTVDTTVPDKYQYIVYDTLILEGSTTLTLLGTGMVVIL